MASKPMTKKQWAEYVTKTFSDCVEHTYKELIDEAVMKAVLAEREACAKVCDDIERRKWETLTSGGEMGNVGAKDCAKAIRARLEL